jgi:predicted RNA polymerase sigma factor
MVRDVGVAEELAQDAFLAAIEHWTRDGVPDKPGAWLMATPSGARSIACASTSCTRASRSTWTMTTTGSPRSQAPIPKSAADDLIGDDVLRLVFTACHPVLSEERRSR